jgi:tetratricopeptide (TPR) repeat protein
LDKGESLSYTQWEAWLALYHGNPLLVVRPTKTAPRGLRYKPTAKSRRAQAEHLRRLESYETYPAITFANNDDLAKQLAYSAILDLLAKAGTPRADKPKNLPYSSLGGLFKGRDEFLARLRASLQEPGGGKAAIVSGALYGMGGVGKTRAAVEYALAHENDYVALLFATGETPESLRANIAALARVLRLAKASATEQQAQYEAAIGWLNRNPGWLLILDNIDSKAALAEANSLLGRLSGGHVVMTSRLTGFGGEIEPLHLDILTGTAAAEFLLERTAKGRKPAPDIAARARELGRELGRLALALEHAGAYIKRRGFSFAAYAKEWATNRATVLAWSDPAVTHYPSALAITWRTSVAQLSPQGKALLARLAFLAHEPIPESLLETPVPGTEPQDWAEALADLADYSLVIREDAPARFTVHRIVQDVTRRSLDAEPRLRALTEALDWVNDSFTGDPGDVRNWPTLEPLAPHAQAVAEAADREGIAEPTGRLMGEIAVLLEAKALYRQSEPLKRRTLAIGEAILGKDHPEVAIRLNNLAQLLRATNRLAEAEPLMRRALAIDEASFGENHPTVAIRLSNLAALLYNTKRLAEAEPLMWRALTIYEAISGKDHPNVAILLNNLAQVLCGTNRLAEAEPLMRRALAIDEASFGEKHPNVARHLSNLALFLQVTNRRAEAEPLMRRALAIDVESFGEKHPDVAVRLQNLAQSLWATDGLAEAEPLMRRGLQIFLAFTRDTGHPHPHLNTAFGNYAGLLQAMGLGEAEVATRIDGLVTAAIFASG